MRRYPFEVASGWHEGRADIASYAPEELFGTKLRALLQRSKGRDLFDLDEGLRQLALDGQRLVACCEHYLAREGNPISRAQAEQRMLAKLARSLAEDIAPLLPAGVRFDEAGARAAFGRVWTQLIARMRGEPWKESAKRIEELRGQYPDLLRGA